MSETARFAPALTAEEWADEFAYHGEDEHESRDNGDVTFDGDGTVTTSLPIPMYERHVGTRRGASLAHALAAVFLLGQPFGFTREDVEKLQSYATAADRGDADFDYYHGGMMSTIDAGWARSLAGRIAALLPPEGAGEDASQFTGCVVYRNAAEDPIWRPLNAPSPPAAAHAAEINRRRRAEREGQ